MKIRIAACGQVSSGKSTGVNAIIGRYICPTAMKRNTKSINRFTSNKNENLIPIEPEKIKLLIDNINDSDDISEKHFYIKLPFVDEKSLECTLSDYPGFNDGKEDLEGMENLFYSHIHEIDYIIYIIDATCPLLYKSEKDLIINILDKIKTNHKNNKYIRVMFMFNKLDDDGDNEIAGMIDDAKQWLKDKMVEMDIDVNDNWFLSVSLRKMMMFSIYNNTGNLNEIPENILIRSLTDMYGKVRAREIVKDGSTFSLSSLTQDEKQVFEILDKTADKQFNIDYMSKKFSGKLRSNILDGKIIVFSDIIECIENHKHLNQTDIINDCLTLMENNWYKYISMYEKTHQQANDIYNHETYSNTAITRQWIIHFETLIAIHREYVSLDDKNSFDLYVKRLFNKYIQTNIYILMQKMVITQSMTLYTNMLSTNL